MNVWKCKRIFPTDTLQQNIEITDLKHFLDAENTSVLIIYIYVYYMYNILLDMSAKWLWLDYVVTTL